MRRSVLCLCFLLVANSSAPAHDGGFGHSRRTLHVTSGPGEFLLEYRVTQTADVALVEMTLIDQDGDGQISVAERDSYFTTALAKLAKQLQCTTIRGKAIPIEPVNYELQQGLGQIFRFRIATDEPELLLVDRAFPHKPGIVRVLTDSSVSAKIGGNVDMTHAELVVIRLTRTKP